MPSPRNRHCECHVCCRSTYIDNLGDKRQGQLVDPMTLKRHQIRQAKHLARQDTTTELKSILIKTTIEAAESASSTGSLPVRNEVPATKFQSIHATAADIGNTGGSSTIQAPLPTPIEVHNEKSCQDKVDNTPRIFNSLARINSEIDVRSKQFDLLNIKLSFRAPVSLSEPLPQLESDGASNDDFIMHREWLVSTLDILDGIKDFGNKEIAGRRAGLAKRIEREINSLLAFEETQWRMAKIRANLYGSRIESSKKEPVVQADLFYGHEKLPKEPFLLDLKTTSSPAPTISTIPVIT